MKAIKNTGFNLFPSGNGWWLSMLWMFFSINGFAQFHVSDGAVLSIAENTILYVADETFEIPSAIQKESQPKKIAKHQKKINTPLQPPIVKKDTEPEKRIGVHSFTSKPKEPSALFYSGKTAKAALVQNTSSGAKSFSDGNAYNDTAHSFLLHVVETKIKVSSNGFLFSQQTDLEENTTRPPPFSDQVLI